MVAFLLLGLPLMSSVVQSEKSMDNHATIDVTQYSLSSDYVIVNMESPVAEVYLLKNGVRDETTPYQFNLSPYNFWMRTHEWVSTSGTGVIRIELPDTTDPYAYGTISILVNYNIIGEITVHHGYW